MKRESQQKFSIATLVALLPLVSGLPVQAQVQGGASGELLGKWMKAGTGETIDFKANGDLDIFLSGQATSFSGNGSFDRCSDGGANLCITGARLKCAYRYSVVQGVLNLQFRSGAPDVACKAAAGDFRSMK